MDDETVRRSTGLNDDELPADVDPTSARWTSVMAAGAAVGVLLGVWFGSEVADAWGAAFGAVVVAVPAVVAFLRLVVRPRAFAAATERRRVVAEHLGSEDSG